MKELLDTTQGVPALLASLVVILALQLVVSVGRVIWGIIKSKNDLSEQTVKDLSITLQLNTKAVEKLETSLKEIEQEISEIPKFKKDLTRLFSAVKFISGPQWPHIRKTILEDESLSP